MLKFIEYALAVYGMFGLVFGILFFSRTRAVRGLWARLLGALALVPVAAGVALLAFSKGDTFIVETGVVVVVVILVLVLGLILGAGADEPLDDGDEPADLDEWDEYEETDAHGLADPDADGGGDEAGDEPAELDPEASDAPAATGPASESLDYFDTIAEHLEYFDMSPPAEQLDYFDTKGGGEPDPLDDLDPNRGHAEPDR
jgi:hypothetical protein